MADRQYELVYILPPDTTEQQVTELHQQVEAVVDLSRRFGRKVATPEEAREILKIGVSYSSVEETLQNLGLPPNRAGGERGFMV